MTDREQESQEDQEGFGWFGVPPGSVVKHEEMEVALARSAIRPEDMDAVERGMWEAWEKRQQREQAGETEDAG